MTMSDDDETDVCTSGMPKETAVKALGIQSLDSSSRVQHRARDGLKARRIG